MGCGYAEALLQQFDVVDESGRLFSGLVIFHEHLIGATMGADIMGLYEFVSSEAFIDLERSIFGGSQVITSLTFSLWKIRAWVVPAMFPTPKVKEAFDEKGNPADKAGVDKRATGFLDELMWCIEAKQRMNN